MSVIFDESMVRIESTLTFQPNLGDPLIDEAQGSTVIWIGAGTSFAAALLAIGAFVFLVGCRHRSLQSATQMTESGLEVISDSQLWSIHDDLVLSEENALSARGWIE
jgi:hypothetical protein